MGVFYEDAIAVDEGVDVFASIAYKQAVVVQLVARERDFHDVPAQDLIPVGGVEEAVHVDEPVLLGKGEDGVIGGGKDGEVAWRVFVVVDDRLADEVVVEQVGVDFLLEQGVIWAVDHNLINGRLRRGGGGHAVVDDVDHSIVGGVIGFNDVDPIDGQTTVRVLSHQGIFSEECGQ